MHALKRHVSLSVKQVLVRGAIEESTSNAKVKGGRAKSATLNPLNTLGSSFFASPKQGCAVSPRTRNRAKHLPLAQLPRVDASLRQARLIKLKCQLSDDLFGHMWNGPSGKPLPQTAHYTGTVRSYVRPVSAVDTEVGCRRIPATRGNPVEIDRRAPGQVDQRGTASTGGAYGLAPCFFRHSDLYAAEGFLAFNQTGGSPLKPPTSALRQLHARSVESAEIASISVFSIRSCSPSL